MNRGTAFTQAQHRELGLVGLLPTGVTTLFGQSRRTNAQYLEQANDLGKWVLFYRLLCEHISEMLPIVCTPTVAMVYYAGDRAEPGEKGLGFISSASKCSPRMSLWK
jgi:hypothetical protein